MASIFRHPAQAGSGRRTYEAQVTRAAGSANWRKFVKESFDGLETLVGATPKGLANEVLAHAGAWSFKADAPAIKSIPLLVITSDDGFAPDGEALAREVARLGGPRPQVVHMTTDHPYSDHRIALQETVAGWLAGLP